LSVTEYMNSSRGAGKVGLPGCCIILANGLRFQSSEAVFGSWLARVIDWTVGRRSIEVLFIAMHTAECPNVLAFRCTLCALAFKSAPAFAWVAMLKCGDLLPMANVVQ